MPILGTGVIPSGAIGTELQYITRRAAAENVVVGVYNATPLAAALLANADIITGSGLSPITQPLQYQGYVNPQWIGYDGNFNSPSVNAGIANMEFNLKAMAIPIPYFGMEALVQDGYEIVNRLEAVLNDVGNQAAYSVSNAIYTNTSNTSQPIGLPAAIDDGTNASTYGGLTRANYNPANVINVPSNYVNPLDSKRYAAGSVALTRALAMQYIAGVQKNCGELPDFGVCGVGTWQELANDFLGLERYNLTPGAAFTDGVSTGFRAINVAGVPIYCDPQLAEGTLYLLNTSYLSLKIHERAAFAFSGFESLLSNYQLGYLGLVLALMELVCSKPSTCAVVTGLTSISL